MGMPSTWGRRGHLNIARKNQSKSSSPQIWGPWPGNTCFLEVKGRGVLFKWRHVTPGRNPIGCWWRALSRPALGHLHWAGRPLHFGIASRLSTKRWSALRKAEVIPENSPRAEIMKIRPFKSIFKSNSWWQLVGAHTGPQNITKRWRDSTKNQVKSVVLSAKN